MDNPSLTEQAIQQALLMGATQLSQPVPQEEPYSPKFRKIGLPAILAGAGLDVISTFDAGRRGLAEGNPVLGSDAKKAALISALASGGVAWLLDKGAKKSPTADKIMTALGLGLGGVRGGIGIRNFGVGR